MNRMNRDTNHMNRDTNHTNRVRIIKPILRYRVEFICCGTRVGVANMLTYDEAWRAGAEYVRDHHWRGFKAVVHLADGRVGETFEGLDSADDTDNAEELGAVVAG